MPVNPVMIMIMMMMFPESWTGPTSSLVTPVSLARRSLGLELESGDHDDARIMMMMLDFGQCQS